MIAGGLLLLLVGGAIVLVALMGGGFLMLIKLGVIFNEAARTHQQDMGGYSLDQGREVRSEQDQH